MEECRDTARADDPAVGVRSPATGERNVVATAVCEDGDDLARVAAELSGVGLAVVDEELIRTDRIRPFSGFDPDRSGGD